MNKFLFCGPIFLYLAAVIWAPNLSDSQGQLSVVVTDSDQQPLPGVTVELCSSALERIRRAISDGEGACAFEDLPPGLYQIRCDIAGFKPVLRKNIGVPSRGELLKLSMEKKPYGVMVITTPGPPPPVDPTITSFTSEDADILSKTSSTLYEKIASAWEIMDTTTDICDKRPILKEVLHDIKAILERANNKLTAFPQASQKRFMINAIFDGMGQHLECDLDSINEFDKNALNLRSELSAMANFFERVSDTRKAAFDLHISSIPEEAEVTYRYEYDGPLKDHHERTPTTIKDLYFAPIIIIFKQEGRTSVAGITYDPFWFFEAGIHQMRMKLLDKDEWGASYKNAPPLKGRVNQSDLIIVGKVHKSECRQEKESSDVYTYITLIVEDCIKGAKNFKGNDIVIKKLGGSIKEDGIIHHVERHPAGFSQPGFSENERVLLLLRSLPDSVHYEVVTGRHGKFSITEDDIIAGKNVTLKEFIRKIKE